MNGRKSSVLNAVLFGRVRIFYDNIVTLPINKHANRGTSYYARWYARNVYLFSFVFSAIPIRPDVYGFYNGWNTYHLGNIEADWPSVPFAFLLG